jgi:hypothetical protein
MNLKFITGFCEIDMRLRPHDWRNIPISLKTFSAGVAREREVGEAVIIKPERNDAKSESWGLEDVFERPQISRQTRMPNLMERKSTRRVENGPSRPA